MTIATLRSRPFRLFPVDYAWWTDADYGSLLTAIERFRPKRVLEFGPGGSTLAIIEGGAQSIDTCEDRPDWLDRHSRRIGQKYAGIVRFHSFVMSDLVSVPALDDQQFDLAFIDGPKHTGTRLPVIQYAQARAPIVVCHDYEGLTRVLGLQFDPIGTVGVLQC